MASSRTDKKEKKEKHRSKDGVHKTKKESRGVMSPEAEAMLVDAAESDGDEGTAHNGRTVPITVPKVALVPFANPLADEKTGKKVLKGVKRAARAKTLKRGVKEVVKSLRKSQIPSASASADTASPHHVCVLAADISPMDVISHIPVLCEDHGVPYVYVTSRADLGAAGQTKRPTSVVLVGKDAVGRLAEKAAKTEGRSLEQAQQEWEEQYGDLVKVVRKAGRDVRV